MKDFLLCIPHTSGVYCPTISNFLLSSVYPSLKRWGSNKIYNSGYIWILPASFPFSAFCIPKEMLGGRNSRSGWTWWRRDEQEKEKLGSTCNLYARYPHCTDGGCQTVSFVIQGIVRLRTILPSLQGHNVILPFQKTNQLYQLMGMLALQSCLWYQIHIHHCCFLKSF